MFNSANPPVAFDVLGPWAIQVGATLPGLTVGPIIGQLSMYASTATGFLWFGFIVANREAIAAGTESYNPSSAADRTLDWMLLESWARNTGDDTHLIRYQTRSMRKLEDVGQSLFLIVDATSSPVSAQFHTNTLVLLP